MKTNCLVFIVVAALLLGSCNIGAKKDLLSGLKITNSGLNYNEGYLSRAQIKLTTSEFSMGDTVYTYLDGIEGYVEKEGKVYKGASMAIIDPAGKKVMEAQDVYANYDATGESKDDASSVSLMLITGSPLVSGVKYIWKSKIWDKNGKGVINTEVEFTIK